MAENHREFTRVKTMIPVTITYPAAAGRAGGTFSAVTQDVSLNGVFARLDLALPVGTAVDVILDLDPIRIEAKGRVVRALPGGLAIHFDELVEVDSYEHLRNLILYNAADPAQAEQEFDSHLGLRRADPSQPPA